MVWEKGTVFMCEPVVIYQEIAYSKYPLVSVVNLTSENVGKEKKFFSSHWHEELEIILNMNAGNVFYIDGQRIQADKGRMIVINPESIHSSELNMNDKGMLGIVVFLHPKFLKENFMQYKDCLFVNDNDRYACPEICDIMLKLSECSMRKEYRPDEYKLYVKGLLLQLLFYMEQSGMIREGNINNKYQTVEKTKVILNYLKAHYQEGLTQENVAKHFGFTPQYFSYYFKRNTGKTFTEYVMYYRVQQSKKDLERSDKRILDIALANGFTEERRFTAAFKRFYNETPLQFRKRFMNI